MRKEVAIGICLDYCSIGSPSTEEDVKFFERELDRLGYRIERKYSETFYAKWKIDWYRLFPSFWLQDYKTNWVWDKLLNDLMDTFEPEFEANAEETPSQIRFGDVVVWVDSYPFSYGKSTAFRDALPSVKTRLRLKAIQARLEATGISQKIQKS